MTAGRPAGDPTVVDALSGADGTADPVTPLVPATVWSDPTADDLSLVRTGRRATPPPPVPGQQVTGLAPPVIDEAARARAERELAAERAAVARRAQQRSAGRAGQQRGGSRPPQEPVRRAGAPQPPTPFLPAGRQTSPAPQGTASFSSVPVQSQPTLAGGRTAAPASSPDAIAPALQWLSTTPAGDRRAAARAALTARAGRARAAGKGKGGNAAGCLVLLVFIGIAVLQAGTGLIENLVDLVKNLFSGR